MLLSPEADVPTHQTSSHERGCTFWRCFHVRIFFEPWWTYHHSIRFKIDSVDSSTSGIRGDYRDCCLLQSGKKDVQGASRGSRWCRCTRAGSAATEGASVAEQRAINGSGWKTECFPWCMEAYRGKPNSKLSAPLQSRNPATVEHFTEGKPCNLQISAGLRIIF